MSYLKSRISGRRLGLAALTAMVSAVMLQAQVQIEYVAHAAFIIQSESGLRVAVDPYNTNRWLGYSFPEGQKADAVFVTHPHYDHDANYNFGLQIPVFREPGRYRIGDIEVLGLEGRHADPYGKEFEQKNTIWVIESGGTRLLHVGDNGPLTPGLVGQVGRIDALMLPVDGLYHILKKEEVTEMIEALQPSIVIPMHYKIPELGKDIKDLGPVDPWLKGKQNVVRLSTNLFQLRPGQGEARRIVVFRHSPTVESWSQDLKGSWRDAGRGYESLRAGKAKEAERYFRSATRRSPQVIGFWAGLSSSLQGQGHTENALRILQTGLLASEMDDWEHTLTARLFLGNLYAQRKLPGPARRQARLVLLNSHRTSLLEQARELLERVGQK